MHYLIITIFKTFDKNYMGVCFFDVVVFKCLQPAWGAIILRFIYTNLYIGKYFISLEIEFRTSIPKMDLMKWMHCIETFPVRMIKNENKNHSVMLSCFQ